MAAAAAAAATAGAAAVADHDVSRVRREWAEKMMKGKVKSLPAGNTVFEI